MVHFKFTKAMKDAANAQLEPSLHLGLAQEIRAFRPWPVRNLSDRQLAWVVGRSRRAALEFGVRDQATLKHWVMVGRGFVSPRLLCASKGRRPFPAQFW